MLSGTGLSMVNDVFVVSDVFPRVFAFVVVVVVAGARANFGNLIP
jgi:hypothetical protein